MTCDGVAVVRRGDTVLICYQKAARIQRTRWLFDVIDGLTVVAPDGLMGLLIVLETADPPDAETRAENTKRLAALGKAVRRLVTVPVGDAFRTSIVRSVMRALNLALGYSNHRIVADTIGEGIACLLEDATPRTPSREQLVQDVEALHVALSVAAPERRVASVVG